MHELITTTRLVKSILEIDPHSRNSDCYLYLQVIEHEALVKGIDIDNMTVEHFLLNRNNYGFAAFETVRRTRQKVQQEFPHLAGDFEIRKGRAAREETFRAYAKGDIR